MKKNPATGIVKELCVFSMPLLASNLLQLIISQISFAIVSRLSVSSLSAVNTIDSFLFSMNGILGVLCVAFNMLASKSLGQRDKKSFNQYVSSILVLNTVIGSLFFLLVLLFGPFFLRQVYGFTGELLEVAKLYLFSLAPFVLLTLYSFAMTNILKVAKKTWYILGISLAAALLQIGLSDVLINGRFVFPKMGVVGAGIALNVAVFVTLLAYTFLVKELLKKALKEKPIYMKRILKKGLPLLGQEILEGFIFIIFFEAMIARLGQLNLAVYALVAQGLTIIKLPTFMLGNAVTIFVSEAYGQKNSEKVLTITKFAFGLSLLGYVFFAFLLYFFRQPFLGFFSQDAQVLGKAMEKLPTLFLLSVSTVGYEISKYSLQSIDQEKFTVQATFWINFSCMAGILGLRWGGVLSFERLFWVYFLNFFILSGIFTGKLKQTAKR